MIDAHRQAFKEEAYELLGELETSLLELEERPDDPELISRVFRAMHTIKGSGAMFGFDDIATFTHEVETVFDQVRNGVVAVTSDLVGLTLAARDQIKEMLDCCDAPEAIDRAREADIITKMKAYLPGAAETPAAQPAQHQSREEVPGRLKSYRIRFRPPVEIFRFGTNPLSLIAELRDLGSCRVVAQLRDLPPLEELDPEGCYVFWDIILTTAAPVDSIRDVFIFVEDDSEIRIDLIDDGLNLDADDTGIRVGDILLQKGDLSKEDLDEVLATRKLLGELLVEKNKVSAEQVHSALVEQQVVKELRRERQGQPQAQDSISSVRIPAEKLDLLVNLVGELVTVQAHLTQLAGERGDAALVTVAEEVERLISELRDNTLNMRMLPIGSTFSKFKRLVRDLSGELGKEVELTTEGAETELDKTVIEKLNDPLVHLIRNSIDHGIESPADRLKSGKPAGGTVHLAAMHSGDSVIVTIRDDGAGLDPEAIRAKAEEKGVIPPNADLSEKEIFNLIFAPGFSTAKKVTSVSGRGVGMDVVKKAIEALRGSISITSKRGEGTTITVKIPLTLAIIESLLVKIGGDCFVLPLPVVEECVELTAEDVAKAHGRNIANVRGQIVPYVMLRDRFGITQPVPELQQIVITHVNGLKVGLVVDEVVGEHQTVIKSLGKVYRNVDGLSGATILGDGTVALILDIPHLVTAVEVEENAVRH